MLARSRTWSRSQKKPLTPNVQRTHASSCNDQGWFECFFAPFAGSLTRFGILKHTLRGKIHFGNSGSIQSYPKQA
jgi:hypothetical protein